MDNDKIATWQLIWVLIKNLATIGAAMFILGVFVIGIMRSCGNLPY